MKKKYSIDRLLLDSIKGLKSFNIIAMDDYDHSDNLGTIPNKMLIDHMESFKELSHLSGPIIEKMIDLYQEITISNPSITIYRTKKQRTENVYFNAKVNWLMKSGVKKELAVYLGKAEEFENRTDHPEAVLLAQKKLKLYLRNKKNDGL